MTAVSYALCMSAPFQFSDTWHRKNCLWFNTTWFIVFGQVHTNCLFILRNRSTTIVQFVRLLIFLCVFLIQSPKCQNIVPHKCYFRCEIDTYNVNLTASKSIYCCLHFLWLLFVALNWLFVLVSFACIDRMLRNYFENFNKNFFQPFRKLKTLRLKNFK